MGLSQNIGAINDKLFNHRAQQWFAHTIDAEENDVHENNFVCLLHLYHPYHHNASPLYRLGIKTCYKSNF